MVERNISMADGVANADSASNSPTSRSANYVVVGDSGRDCSAAPSAGQAPGQKYRVARDYVSSASGTGNGVKERTGLSVKCR